MTSPWRVHLAPAMVAGAILATACSSGGTTPAAVPGPDTTVAPIEAPAQLPDTRNVALAAVPGDPPPEGEITVRGGDADLVGVVRGPDGPVAGATVLLERFASDRRASLDVRTDRTGRFRALDVHGGRYRIRAWKAPTLALTTPALHFIRDDTRTTVDLDVTSHDGLDVQAVVDRSAPLVDQAVTVTALVTDQQVDGRGIVTAPAAERSAVRLTAGPGWRLDAPAAVTVNGDGRAVWTVTCTAPGPSALTVRAGSDAAVTIATSCQEPVEAPEVDDDPPPAPDFAIGSTFTPPFAGELPAGRYAVVTSPGSCGISFQRYTNGGWDENRSTATGTTEFVVSTAVRDVRVIGDSQPCTYERVA